MKLKSLIVQLLLVALVTTTSSLAKASMPTEMLELHASNVLMFDRDIDEAGADIFVAALLGKRSALPIEETLYIILISSGGHYTEAKMMRAIIGRLPNIAVICKQCNSAAGFLMATAKKRIAISKSVMIMHEMSMERFTAATANRPAEIATLIEESEEFNKDMYKVIGISREEYEEKIIDKEWELHGEELLRNNLADQYVNLHCDPYMKRMAPDTCSK